jgi:nucleoside-diphosphate kinase
MERTFVMVKPDGVRRGLVGEIIGRFEAKGLRIAALKQLTPSRDLAEAHYAVHRGKPFFAPVVEFITSGPVVAMVLEGPEGTVDMVRLLMGKTSPLEAAPGTIRGDFASTTQENLVHGSDSLETAAAEIALWFPEMAAASE